MPAGRRTPSAAPAPPAAGQSPTAVYSGEEYLRYFESTEKVVDRRLALNSWNYGVCIAIIVACGFVATLAISNAEFRVALMLGVIFLSAMGILLCHLWRKQIKDYKSLNDAKFSVLNEMAPRVKFQDGGCSYEPFRKEWDRLSATGGTVSQSGLRDKVLKASHAELIMPWAFMSLFGLILILVAITATVNWRTLLDHPLEFRANSVAEARK
jgi:hypothetical protein